MIDLEELERLAKKVLGLGEWARLKGNRCIITDFFIDDLHDRSRRIYEHARELRKLFDRQHIAAVNLMRFK